MTLEPQRLRIDHRSLTVDAWTAGDGPPVVVLHGWGLSGRPYRPVVAALAKQGFRAVAPSISVMEPPWSLPGLAAVIADVLASLDAVPAALVGHSFGGAVSIRLAADFPHLPRALVLANTLGVAPGRRAFLRTVVPGPHWRVGMQRSTAAALFSSAARAGGVASLIGSARWVMSGSLDEELRALRDAALPATVLWAEGDTLLPRVIGERAAELLGCPFEPVPAGDGWPLRRAPDHDWPMRAPEFFARRVAEALRKLSL